MQLIYRAQLIDYTPAPVRPYVKPRALNWRFQAPGENYGTTTAIEPEYTYRAPRALNWRFRMAIGA